MGLLDAKFMVAEVELDLTAVDRVIARYKELLPLMLMAGLSVIEGNVPDVVLSRISGVLADKSLDMPAAKLFAAGRM